MAEHTPGPWTYREPPESLDRPIAYWVDGPGAGGAMPIADIVTNIAQAEANARLIASSPNLLAVAKLAQSLLSEEYGDSYEVLKQLDAAIAKAEGREG